MAFVDGVYNYVCAECNAFCCRGQGFGGSLQREMKPLFEFYPGLGSMVTHRSGDYVQIANPASECFMLERDNLCRIEKDHGKAAKPSVCLLFPFNRFWRIGQTVVVTPHFMCPLRLQIPARVGEVEGAHKRLEATLRESQYLAQDLDSKVSNPRLHPAVDAALVLRREEAFREDCAKALGRRRFGETLRAISSEPEMIDEFIARATRILGLVAPPRPPARDQIDDLLLALASPFRMELLSLAAEGILRALALSEVLLRQALTFSHDPSSVKGAYSVVANQASKIRLLARDQESLASLPLAAQKSPQFGDAELAFTAFTALREFSRGTAVLSALERAIPADLSVADRSALLSQLGHQVDATIAPQRKKRKNQA
jgi:hypothetical protein